MCRVARRCQAGTSSPRSRKKRTWSARRRDVSGRAADPAAPAPRRFRRDLAPSCIEAQALDVRLAELHFLVTGQNDAAAATHMRFQLRLHQLGGFAVQSGERLIEDPQGLDCSERKPRQVHAASLSLRQSTRHDIDALLQTEFRQSGPRFLDARADARLRKAEAQILERCEVVLHCRCVARVEQICAELLTCSAYFVSAPANGARVGTHQSAQQTQQRGLAATVCPLHPEHFAGPHREAQTLEQASPTAYAFQIDGLQPTITLIHGRLSEKGASIPERELVEIL